MNLDRTVVENLQRTIRHPETWYDALQSLCEVCGAQKALITLRDTATAEIIVPTHVQEAHNSPLIYGFEEFEVADYLGNYQQIDPWTQFEKAIHPHVPYLLSEYVPLVNLQRSPFWKWLQPQKISDTLVAEIGDHGSTWAAINLYFHPHTKADQEQVLAQFLLYFDLLKSVWSIGYQLRAQGLFDEGYGKVLQYMDRGAIIVDSESRVISHNDLAMSALGGDLFVECTVGNVLKFNERKYTLDRHQEFSNLVTKVSLDGTLVLRISSAEYANTEFVDGHRRHVHMLFLDPARNVSQTPRPIWDEPGLTAREQALARFSAEGGRLVDFQRAQGLSKSRCGQISKNLRRKLGMAELIDIYVAHRTFLERV